MKGIKNNIFAGFTKLFCGILATSMALPTAPTWSNVPGLLTPIILFIVLTAVALIPAIVGCFTAFEHFDIAFNAKSRGLGNH